MRRSYRDAIVGFSLIGGVVIFSGLTFWLQGIKVSKGTWSITAKFTDATGLSEGTPVTFRGIQIGNVKQITITPKDVQAKIRINSKDIILFKPVSAKIETSSLLGGDAQISIISQGKPIDKLDLKPIGKKCLPKLILCEGDYIQGADLTNISRLTGDINKLLNEAENNEVIKKIVASIEQFDSTQENLDELIRLSKQELNKAKPIVEDLKRTVDHMNNILGSIDDPKVLGNIKSSTNSIRSFTAKIDKISDKVDELINDEDLTNAIKDAAIGVGKLFKDIYE
ncbi:MULTISPECIES: MlaD family protein [unclassified Prochlorococcus]|uniref:MlaD family protein n=1 Tax=unclassified Prochlorococcus TaxID=2627481 RepID=UPI000533A173|nr:MULTISPECIES: MlaD family protein [unclassified Prochlorococcus]KGG16639.1 putative ABC transporter precursor [Prochlorococcus sp. MIT 0602]KGG18389.1 putative ABC transporter precursor [Prochlorococcus sp. MIT 0603]